MSRRLGRRNARGGGGGNGRSPWLGIGNLTTANYYTTAADNGTHGTAAGFFDARVVRIVTVATSQWLGSCASASGGWAVRQLAATTVQWRVSDGAAGVVVSPAITLTGFEGKHVGLVFVHDGTTLRSYFNGVEVGVGTAITGYTAPAVGTGHVIAKIQNSGSEWFGECSGESVPSAQNIADWWAGVKSARRCVAMPGVTTDHLWDRVTGLVDVADSVGGHTMSKVGTGHTLAVATSPSWGA